MWDAVLSAAKDQKKLVAVKFGAEWCKPCKRIAPLYEELAKESSKTYIFTTVDVDEVADLAMDCGAKALPTFQVHAHTAMIKTWSPVVVLGTLVRAFVHMATDRPA